MTVHIGEVEIAELRDFFEAASTLDQEAFSRLYGEAFLLQPKGARGLRPPPPASRTEPDDEVVEEALDGSANTEPGRGRAELAFLVWPVRDSGRAVGTFISVGRTANNDLAIPDASVSKVHALLNRTERGDFRVRSAPSAKLLKVNGEQGREAVLHSGDSLQLGRVQLTFLDAAGLHALARRVSGRRA